jgi:hypothetical protein
MIPSSANDSTTSTPQFHARADNATSVNVAPFWVRCASGYPYQRIFAKILANLRAHYLPLRI